MLMYYIVCPLSDRYGTSEHVKSFVALFRNVGDGSVVPSKQDSIHCRNYIMLMVTIAHACRASNIQNITLKDLDNVFEDKEYVGAKIINSVRYKTSMLYGAKKIVISGYHFTNIEIFVKYMRQYLVTDSHLPKHMRYV